MRLAAILATAVLLAASLVGYGSLSVAAWRWLARKPLDPCRLGDAGLLGVAVLMVLGQVVHFARPLSPSLAVLIHAGGLACLAGTARSSVLRPTAGEASFATVSGLAFLAQALNDRPALDAGVYHVTAIMWNAEFPLIPGLGNLHGRLAFNSSIEVLGATLKLPALSWGGAFFANLFVGWFVMIALFQRVCRSVRPGEAISLSMAYGLIVLGSLSAHSFYFKGAVGSLASDFAPAMLAVYGVHLLLEGLERDRVSTLAWAVVLSCLAVTVKLSAAALLGGSLVVAVCWLSRGRQRDLGAAIAGGMLAAVLLLSWIGRGLALSGCALYPESWSCLSGLPWAVPRNLALNEARFVLDYARGSQAPPDGPWVWVSPLWRELTGNRKGILVLAMIGGGALLMALGRGTGRVGVGDLLRRRRGVDALLVTSIPLLGIGLAVVKGPALRFTFGYWYSLGALWLAGGALSVGPIRSVMRSTAGRWPRLLPVVLCVLLAVQGATSAWGVARSGSGSRWPELPPPLVVERTTATGLRVMVSRSETCWDAPLPCTPLFHPALSRVPFGNRFYLTGSNEAVYWPGVWGNPR